MTKLVHKKRTMKHLLSNQARIFQAIVEAGSITGAAERLQIGKSGVSDALRQLETWLGAQLLIRTTRRQTLTAIGERFYHRCRALDDLSKVALEEVNEHLAEPMGPLRITAPHATINSVVAPAIADLLRRYPRDQPELIVDDQRLDLIKDNIDLALTAGVLPDSEYKAQRIGGLCDVLCASSGFCADLGLSGATAIDPARVVDLPYVAHHWEGADVVHHLKSRASDTTEAFRFRRVATANSVNAVCSLIAQGVGVGLLPHFFVKPHLDNGEMTALLPRYRPQETNLYAIHPYGEIPPLSVRAMIEAMKTALRGTV